MLSVLDNPLVTGGLGLAAYLAFVFVRLAYWAHGQVSLFIGAGVVYANSAQLPPGIHQVLRAGYDGQFYYRLALNPFNWAHTAYGIRMDEPYRYTRIGYPLLTWVLSAGRHGWVPVLLVVVNLLAVAALGVLGGIFARDGGRSALWGLTFVAFFGLVVSVGRDTAEPLADACMLGGLLCYRRGRYLAATALIGYGVITRETILIAAGAIALTRCWGFWRQRAIRLAAADLVWAVPAAAFAVVESAQRIFAAGYGGSASADAARNITWPFAGLADGLRADFRLVSWTHMGLADYNLLEFATLAVVVVMAAAALRSTTAPVHERVAFAAFVVVEAVMASALIWGSWFGELRNLLEVYLLSLVMLMGTPRPQLSRRRLGWIAAIVIPALLVVARRRVLYQ